MEKITFDQFCFFLSVELLSDPIPQELKESLVLVLSHTKQQDPKQLLSVIQGLAQARDNYLPIGNSGSASTFGRLEEINSMDVAKHVSWPQGQRTGSAMV